MNDYSYDNDGNADAYDENSNLSSSAYKRNTRKYTKNGTRGSSKSGKGKAKMTKSTRGRITVNKKKPTRKTSVTAVAQRNAKAAHEDHHKGNANKSPFSIIINSNKTHAVQTGSVIGSCVNDCRNLGNLR